MKKALFFMLFTILPFIPGQNWAKEASSQEKTQPPGGIPGQIEEAGSSRRIYFEAGIFVEMGEGRITLKDPKGKAFTMNPSEAPQKTTARERWGEEVVEQDLGGTLKKKAPLAYKNPKVRNIQLPQGGDPLKSSGMKPVKVNQEKTAEGGTVTTSEYPDGSKSVSYQSGNLKEENSFDRKGDLIWRNLEGTDRGVQYKKTQWQDGSTIREYSRGGGTVSVVYDQARKIYTYSFLNANREILKEVTCQNGECGED